MKLEFLIEKIQKIEDDNTVKMLSIDRDYDIIINANKRVIKINSSEIPILSREAIGVKAIKLDENEEIRDMLINN